MIRPYCKFVSTLFLSGFFLVCSFILAGCGSDEAPGGDDNQKTVANKNLDNLFSDTNLQNCVDAIAAKNQWQMSAQVNGQLDCSNKNIKSLDGLEFLINLTELNLSNNRIVDVYQISKLHKLKVVRLQNNALGSNGEGNVDLLSKLSKPKDINVAGNRTVSCKELLALSNTLNGIEDSDELESAPITKEIVNPEPFDKVNCTM